jgi:signal transduction histidine kinase/DNA-binding NarL/FixJ family response regulator
VAEVGSTDDLEDADAAPAHAVLRAVATTDPVRHGERWLVVVLSSSVPVGVIEIHDGGREVAAVVATASEAIGAHLELIWASRGGELVATELRSHGIASGIQSVILTFSAQVQPLLAHDRLSVYLLTPDGASLERFAVACWPPIPGEMDIRPLEAVGISRVIRTNAPIISADFGVDERILGEEDELIARAGFHAVVSVPLRLVGAAFGLLNFVSRTPGYYTDADIPVAQQIADQIAVFLYDLHLQRATQDQLRRNAAQWERDRVARELHDTLAQSLARLAVKAQALERDLDGGTEAPQAAELTQIAKDALDNLKHSLFNTVPSELQHRSLVEAMQLVAERHHGDAGVAPTLEISGDPDTLAADVQGVVLRITQECLTNAAKHANATAVSVSLHVRPDRLSLSISDNGGGFREQPGRGFGLQAIRGRAREIGGELAVISREGGPTEIHLVAPTRHHAVASRPTDSHGLIRVLVVDDHPIFAEALVEQLAKDPDIRVVGQAATGQEAIALVKLLEPDVVLLDFELPDTTGADVVTELRAAGERPLVVMLSAFGEADHVAASLSAGAQAYIAKTSDAVVLIEAIHSAMRGTVLFNTASWGEVTTPPVKLTAREYEVLHLLVVGASNREIATRIHVAPKTVERIIATIVTKLRARNRTHAVALALARKLVDPRPLQSIG